MPSRSAAIDGTPKVPASSLSGRWSSAFLHNYQNPYYDIDSTAILFASGAITLRTIAEKDSEDDQYVLTNAGYILVKYGLQIEILKPSISKIDIKGMLTAEVVDDKLSFEKLD